ncbi:hypothetical protein HOD20_06765 [archaeon]|nr:hypothetical protein [archaeon]MBT4352206.1 hypothetical protein [archaeon]MBT4647329.1 hypothetical protein [archaeon]MBT6821235.1 hypothetical protein [archaeon]MBT7391287.1 hypothetical protein [archaeon]
MDEKEKLVKFLVRYGKNIKNVEFIGHKLEQKYYSYLKKINKQINCFNKKYKNMKLNISITEFHDIKTHLMYEKNKIPIKKRILSDRIEKIEIFNKNININDNLLIPYSSIILGTVAPHLNGQLINQGYVGY